MQSCAKRHFPIRNPLLYPLSYGREALEYSLKSSLGKWLSR